MTFIVLLKWIIENFDFDESEKLDHLFEGMVEVGMFPI